MATFFTSDTHFGDVQRLRVDRRPFRSVDDMDRAMVERWNAAVEPHDEVWHLGDFAQAEGPERTAHLLASLRGRKHLVIGNNDPADTTDQPGWASVRHYAEMEVDGTGVVVCHYAFRTWNGMGRGVLDLHGHSHGRLKPVPRQFDVGVDVHDFTPVRLAEVTARRRRRASD